MHLVQDGADSDAISNPLAANIAAEVAADDSAAAAADEEEDQEEQEEMTPATAADVIQPDQTVDTGSQHVIKVHSKVTIIKM